jgi:hypothetical protein
LSLSLPEQALEKRIADKGLNAARITPSRIDRKIKDVFYHVFPDTGFTTCLLVLENGFKVLGESSCVSIENFDADIGRVIAFDNARDKIWMLEGYVLKQRSFEDTSAKPVA